MRSIQRRFEQIKKKRSDAGSFVCFAAAIADQRFSNSILSRWFYKLVEPDDYARVERKQLLSYLYSLSNHTDDNVFQAKNALEIAQSGEMIKASIN